MNDSLSRFIGAFNSIHDRFCETIKKGNQTKFSVALGEVSKSKLISDDIKHQLNYLARLRNFLVHGHQHPAVLAVPSAEAVELIEKIKYIVLSPPLLSDLFTRSVVTCEQGDPVEEGAKKMHAGDFSQLPVYERSNCLGLLTAETIARWMASCVTGGLTLDLKATVSAVLPHQEKTSVHDFLSDKETVFKAIQTFNRHSDSGKSLDAIILTPSGSKNERPTGIITVFDVPQMLKAIRV